MELFANPVYAAAGLMAILAVSEIVSVVTRAWVPSLLVSFVLYLVLRWTGVFPEGITATSTLGQAGATLIGVAIAHMGTMMPLEQLREQWKAIVIALGGVVGIVALILPTVSLLFDYPTAVAGVGPVAGGVMAFLITSQRLTELGLESIIVIPALVLGIQSLIGMPLANTILRKYAVKVRDSGRELPLGADDHHAAAALPVGTGLRGQIIGNRVVLLTILFLISALCQVLMKVTDDWVNYAVWALILGIAARWVKIVPPRTLEHSNSFGLTMSLIIIVVVGSMDGVTPAAVAAALGPALLILAAGTIGIILGGFILSKVVGWDWMRGVPVALTALFGFPGDYMVCLEISRSVARTDEERQGIMNLIYSPMLIGGFATVTVSSVVIASVLVRTI